VRRYLDRPAEEILPLLPALSRSAARVEADLTRWVGRLREQGTDWRTIAGALELSVQAARERFEVKPPLDEDLAYRPSASETSAGKE
jgi:hypothetical protein